MTDFLQEKRKEIEDRLRELQPLVDEYRQLEQAAAALAGLGSNGKSSSSAPKRASKPSSTPKRAKRSGGGRRGRPPGSGKRALQAQQLVEAKPGITIPELAKEMKIQPNYLYRVLPGLQQDGKVKRKGKGWHPGASQAPSKPATEAKADPAPKAKQPAKSA